MSDAGNKCATPQPPQPKDGARIFEWAQQLTQWLRRSRVIPGLGLMGSQASSGYILSSVNDPLIGQVILHGGTLIGTTADRWLECDGATYNIVDYPMLFEAISNAYGGDGVTTFKVPPAGAFPVFAGNSPNFSRDAITYTAGDAGGYNLHGKTENNHLDHSFDLDLEHLHDISGGSTGLAAGDAGGISVMTPTTTPDTDGPRDWGTADKVPSGTNDSEQGSISKVDDVVTVTLKHRGHVTPATNSGGRADDTDNRPAFAAFKAYIRALP